MKRFLIPLIIATFISQVYSQQIRVLTVEDSIINPVIKEYIIREIAEAEKNNEIVIIRLDTPGGLLKPTQEIVKKILNAQIPVITYVSPKGSKAASAGVFISLASHLLVMAPSTHIGAAHPIIGGGKWGELSPEIKEKIMNDTIKWGENIAQTRGKPISFVREAIKKSVSITAKEAVKQGVCDFIAKDLDELIAQLHNRKIKIDEKKEIILDTKNSKIQYVNMTKKEKFINALIDPNVVYILFLLGILGLIYEITHPGFGIPGIAGIFLLFLAFYALNILPVNYVGILLLIFGVIFLIAEILTPTFGFFTFASVIFFVAGTFLLFNQPLLIKVSSNVFLSLISFFILLTLFLMMNTVKTHRQKVLTGKEGIIGKIAHAYTDIDEKKGKIIIHGEIWNAVSKEPIQKGEEVIVEMIKEENLTLVVKRVNKDNKSS